MKHMMHMKRAALTEPAGRTMTAADGWCLCTDAGGQEDPILLLIRALDALINA